MVLRYGITLACLFATLVVAFLMVYGAFSQTTPARKITIATEGAFPPWNFTEANGQLNGFEIELQKYLCLHMNADCSFVVQPFDGLIPALQAGKYDAIMSGLSVTAKRQEVISFSLPYCTTGQSFAVLQGSALEQSLPKMDVLFLANDKSGSLSEIEKIATIIKGKIVGVQTGSTSTSFLKMYFGDNIIREYQSPEQHDLDLAGGRIDMVFASTAYLAGKTKTANHKGFVLVGPRFQGGVLGLGSGVGLRKEDTDLRQKFDGAIKAALSDGTITRLSEKWFGFDVTPR